MRPRQFPLFCRQQPQKIPPVSVKYEYKWVQRKSDVEISFQGNDIAEDLFNLQVLTSTFSNSMLTERLHPYQRGFLRLRVWDSNSHESSQENVFKRDLHLQNSIGTRFVHYSQHSELFKAFFSYSINFSQWCNNFLVTVFNMFDMRLCLTRNNSVFPAATRVTLKNISAL